MDNRVTRGQVFEKQGEGNILMNRAVKQRSTTPGTKHTVIVSIS